MRRREHFPAQVKERAKQRSGYRCERCNRRDDQVKQLEIHHICSVWFAKNHFPQIAKHVLHSIVNARCLCHECHKKVHRGDRLGANNRKYRQQAKHLEQLQPTLSRYGL